VTKTLSSSGYAIDYKPLERGQGSVWATFAPAVAMLAVCMASHYFQGGQHAREITTPIAHHGLHVPVSVDLIA